MEHGADTRYVDAGLWLCTDASEPQYTSVTNTQIGEISNTTMEEMASFSKRKTTTWRRVIGTLEV